MTRLLRRKPMLLIGLLGVVTLWPALAGACPRCSDALPTGTEPTTAGSAATDGGVEDPVGSVVRRGGGNLAAGFYYSILFMLAVPMALAAGLGGLLYVGVRHAQKSSPLTRAQG